MIETVKRVVCDRCGKAGPMAVASESVAEITRTAGWTMREEDFPDGDYCPGCLFTMTVSRSEARAEQDRRV